MSAFDEYANKYKTARMERRDGVLQVHTDGQSLRWGFLPHYGITQVVDGNWGVHAIIKKSLFAGEA
jgi:hypothetical protein